MSEERVRILNMLEKGEIGVDEANQLLKALGESEKQEITSNKKISSLKILISENNDEKVNISIPLGLAKSLIKFIPKSAKNKLKEEDINLEELVSSIENAEGPRDIVNIKDGGDEIVIRLE